MKEKDQKVNTIETGYIQHMHRSKKCLQSNMVDKSPKLCLEHVEMTRCCTDDAMFAEGKEERFVMANPWVCHVRAEG